MAFVVNRWDQSTNATFVDGPTTSFVGPKLARRGTASVYDAWSARRRLLVFVVFSITVLLWFCALSARHSFVVSIQVVSIESPVGQGGGAHMAKGKSCICST